jgi:LmbE family N-acetylglucosaminyl deacetylase
MANILVVGPHPDDQELGMGGTIARLVKQGHDLLLLDMTNGEPTPYGPRPGGSARRRRRPRPWACAGHACSWASRTAR